ncbi:MAG TPA: hypothetical protein VFG46_27625, partial [Chryseolinea sp.]|nr:hypothetical protein [Chryseolinea sp.]
EAIFGTKAYKQSYQWSEGKIPKKSDETFMAGYSVSKLVKPSKENAHIEAFFTTKGKDLYCIVSDYRPSMLIRNFKPASGTAISILGNSKPLPFKQAGNDCVVDLSGLKPGEISAQVFVIKLKNAL